ncbi:MAG: zf-HC2 domain-containing protein [Ignavibacteria bacterium]|nr:zf-HC2 domain-containing protein [Ignavibacteria bacterium]
MNCNEFIRLIHLNSEGELSEDERDRLGLHLSSCEDCASEARLAGQADHLLNVVRAKPMIPDPDQLLRSILKRTGAEQGKSLPTGFFENLMGFFVRPTVRVAYAAFVILLVSMFMLQQAEALRSVDELGTRFALRSRPPMADVVYSIPLDDARDMVGADEFEPLIAAAPVNVSDNTLRAQKSDLDPWAHSVSPRFLSRILASSVPGLEGIPAALVEMQQSITSSFTLRIGGNNP